MTDVTAGGGGGFDMSRGAMGKLLNRPDLFLAIGVMGILVVLIFPLPSILLDMLLALSIILSVLVLMTALFIEEPLEFSAFPTVLLIVTMLRLALNLASTRLILAHGHEGSAAAGHVIEAFGNFVMGGNFVIGVIVFTILIIVNFVVITKGSGRIAEVAARFALDAMPGKQMAIDADLSAGLIDQEVAKTRRKALEDEANFFGSMDGASKFVRGDAIAGLLITFINVLGGIIIGVAQQGMSFGDAARAYTQLTVGDGLVSQIPALIVSTAAGLLVSKSGVRGAADKALGKQLSGYPKALGMSAAVMALIAVLPGIPMLPFMALALGSAWLARHFGRLAKAKETEVADAAQAASPLQADGTPKEETLNDLLKLDELKIEIGYGLLPLVNSAGGQDRLTDQVRALRRQLAAELGFVMPAVRIVDNVQLEANHYFIKIKEIDAGHGLVYAGQYMAMDPMGGSVNLPGHNVLEPTFGLPATWIDGALQDEAQLRGYTVVDAATVISTHLTEVLKSHMPELLSHGEVQKLLRELPKDHADLLIDHGHPARAADPALRAHLDPRPRHHRRGHRRGGWRAEEPARHRRACPHAAFAADLRAVLERAGAAPDHHALAGLGERLRRIDHRPGRGSPSRHAALAAAGVRPPGARQVRGCGAHGRDAGARHLRHGAAFRAPDHRALPARDAGALAGRDSPARAAEDGRHRLNGHRRRRFPRGADAGGAMARPPGLAYEGRACRATPPSSPCSASSGG